MPPIGQKSPFVAWDPYNSHALTVPEDDDPKAVLCDDPRDLKCATYTTPTALRPLCPICLERRSAHFDQEVQAELAARAAQADLSSPTTIIASSQATARCKRCGAPYNFDQSNCPDCGTPIPDD